MEVKPKELIITKNFRTKFDKAVLYTHKTFGPVVGDKFYDKVMDTIYSLRTNYGIYQECRFMETPEKSFRSFSVNGYSIIYQIHETHVRVFKIIHQSQSPRRIYSIRKK